MVSEPAMTAKLTDDHRYRQKVAGQHAKIKRDLKRRLTENSKPYRRFPCL